MVERRSLKGEGEEARSAVHVKQPVLQEVTAEQPSDRGTPHREFHKPPISQMIQGGPEWKVEVGQEFIFQNRLRYRHHRPQPQNGEIEPGGRVWVY